MWVPSLSLSFGSLGADEADLGNETQLAERLARHFWHNTRSLILHHARRPRRSLDLATHLHQAWFVFPFSLLSPPPLTPTTVTLGGAVLFLIFGCVYAYEAIYFEEVADIVLGGVEAL